MAPKIKPPTGLAAAIAKVEQAKLDMAAIKAQKSEPLPLPTNPNVHIEVLPDEPRRSRRNGAISAKMQSVKSGLNDKTKVYNPMWLAGAHAKDKKKFVTYKYFKGLMKDPEKDKKTQFWSEKMKAIVQNYANALLGGGSPTDPHWEHEHSRVMKSWDNAEDQAEQKLAEPKVPETATQIIESLPSVNDLLKSELASRFKNAVPQVKETEEETKLLDLLDAMEVDAAVLPAGAPPIAPSYLAPPQQKAPPRAPAASALVEGASKLKPAKVIAKVPDNTDMLNAQIREMVGKRKNRPNVVAAVDQAIAERKQEISTAFQMAPLKAEILAAASKRFQFNQPAAASGVGDDEWGDAKRAKVAPPEPIAPRGFKAKKLKPLKYYPDEKPAPPPLIPSEMHGMFDFNPPAPATAPAPPQLSAQTVAQQSIAPVAPYAPQMGVASNSASIPPVAPYAPSMGVASNSASIAPVAPYAPQMGVAPTTVNATIPTKRGRKPKLGNSQTVSETIANSVPPPQQPPPPLPIQETPEFKQALQAAIDEMRANDTFALGVEQRLAALELSRPPIQQAAAMQRGTEPLVNTAPPVETTQYEYQPPVEGDTTVETQMQPTPQQQTPASDVMAGVYDPADRYSDLSSSELTTMLNRGFIQYSDIPVVRQLIKEQKLYESQTGQTELEGNINPADEPNPILRAGRTFEQAQRGVIPTRSMQQKLVNDVFRTGYANRSDYVGNGFGPSANDPFDSRNVFVQQINDAELYTLKGEPDYRTLLGDTMASNRTAMREQRKLGQSQFKQYLNTHMKDRSVYATPAENTLKRVDRQLYNNVPDFRAAIDFYQDTPAGSGDSEWLDSLFRR